MSVWRVPTDDDLKVLEGVVDSTYDVEDPEWEGTIWRGDDAGAALAGSSSLWLEGNLKTHASFDASKINLVPNGSRGGMTGSFVNLGETCRLWTNTVTYIPTQVWYRAINYERTDIFRDGLVWDPTVYGSKGFNFGFAVRLVRDDSSEHPDGTVYPEEYEGNDGKKYDAVKAGPFLILTANLDETKTNAGFDIPEIESNSDWSDETLGAARCYYNNDPNNSEFYGSLYNWWALENIVNLPTSIVYVKIDGEAIGCPVYVNQGGVAVPANVHINE